MKLPINSLAPACRYLALLVLLGAQAAGSAHAWTINITSASRRVFLHVGNGTAESSNGTVNTVSATLSGAQLLSGTAQSMTSNSTQSQSLYDGYSTCPSPTTQMLIGASYRRSNANDGPSSATLSVTSPTNLVNAAGETIPFTEISWTVSQQGTNTPNVIPAGTFNGSTLTLTSVSANTYIENCHSYVYANSAIRAAGTYTGQVTYTIATP